MIRSIKQVILRFFLLLNVTVFATLSGLAQNSFNVNLDVVRDSVVFLHSVDQSGQLKDAGTGFLLVVPTKADPVRGYILLVTARHIVDPQWNGCPVTNNILKVSLNKKEYDPKKDDPGTVEVSAIGGWHFPEDDSVDIAVVVLNGDVFNSLNVINAGIRVTELPTPEELKKVNTGSQIVSAGLLLGASGSKRNYPIFKFGYVSSIPEEKIAVNCCPGGCVTKLETEWMIAASLVPGNSGSPIVYVPPFLQGGRAFLLGVQSSSFLGFDVAGMAPVQYLIDLIRSMNLPDANLGPNGVVNPTPQAQPTSSQPPVPVPGVLPQPH